jgi:FkbM family methyltransferase
MSIVSKTKARVMAVLVKLAPWTRFYLAGREARSYLTVEHCAGWIDVVDRKRRRKIRLSLRHSIYLVDIANFFEYFHSSAAPIRIPSGQFIYDVVDFSTPRYQEISGFLEFPILCPTLTEPFSTTEQYRDFAQLKAGDVVLDLGCYCGLTTIVFSKDVGLSGKVVALEPDPINFSAAQNNFARHALVNKIDNITLMNNAAGPSRKVISFASEGTMGSAEASIIGSDRGDSVMVSCLGLQDIADSCSLEKIDFIKMDIEGSEVSVLAGAEDFFRRYRPNLIVEPHLVDGVSSQEAVLSVLQKYGYQCQTIAQTGSYSSLITARPIPR